MKCEDPCCNTGKRDGNKEGKPQLSYCTLGREVIEGEARVWTHGAEKYDRGNWLKGMSWSECIDSLLRHITALANGEDIDPDSGQLHADLIVCSAKILSNSFHTRKDLDDRYEKSNNSSG